MKLLIAGAGGHGRVVADAAERSSRWSEIAFLDDRLGQMNLAGVWPIVGRFSDLEIAVRRFDGFVAAIGDARLRIALLARGAAAGCEVPAIVHPAAVVSAYASIGAGTVLMAGAVINIGARLGTGCIVNTGATVDHDCILDAGVHVCPGAHLAGDVTVGARTWIGIGAIVRQGIRIGADATLAAGAVCVTDVPENVTVVGVPAREFTR
jgi:sugar O-acyltransferase (sialic acid O-acetyltransferase NeuD family)